MKASKKLIGASVALVAALAVSVGTTYAWFTTNQKVTVSNISATVTTGDSNLEIRRMNANGSWYAGSKWGYSLDLSNDSYLASIVLDQATSENDNNGSELLGKDLETEATAGSYIDLYFAFRTPATDDVEILLSTNSTIESDGNPDAQTILSWTDTDEYGNGYDEEGEEGTGLDANDPIRAKAADAARMAIFYYDVESEVSTADQSITLSSSEEESVGVWNPNKGKGYDEVSGTTGHVLSHDVELILNDVDPDDLAENDSLDDYYDTSKYGSYEDFVAGDDTVVTIAGDSDAKYCYGYIHIRIWLEGTDGDCLNNIFGDTITVNLEFTIKPNSTTNG